MSDRTSLSCAAKMAVALTSLIGLLILGTSCYAPEQQGREMDRTITLDQATERVDDLIERARSAVAPSARLVDTGDTPGRPEAFNPDTMKCEKSTGEDLGTLFASKLLLLENDKPLPQGATFAKIRQWWSDNEFRIFSGTERPEVGDPEGGALFATHRDGFKMSLQHNRKEEFYLGASSPCVWRNGTPDPLA